MASLRPGRCQRKVKRAYTRHSRFKKLSYITGIPGNRVAKFIMGNPKGKFEKRAVMKSKNEVVIPVRQNAIESARIGVTNYMNKVVKPENYRCIIHTYPHQIIREKPIACGAGADRYSTGMARPFGKPIGRAAIVRNGQQIFSIETSEQYLKFAVEALKRAGKKLPLRTNVVEAEPLKS